jgi:hypothetical protein
MWCRVVLVWIDVSEERIASIFREISVHTRTTRRHIPEDGILHSYRREKPKSYITQEMPTETCLDFV